MKAAFFYADDGMVASTDPGWLLLVFNNLAGKFDQVGLRKNVHKNVGWCAGLSGRAAGLRAYEAYTQRMKGEGLGFKERQWEWVLFLEYGK